MKRPLHGYCAVCRGPIPKGKQWTLTAELFRVHANVDQCINWLHLRKNVVINHNGRTVSILEYHKEIRKRIRDKVEY